MKLEQAHKIGLEIITALHPACERIIIAGDIRRSEPNPESITIVYIPRMIAGKTDIFTIGSVPATEARIAKLTPNFWYFDRAAHKYDTAHYKRLIHPHTDGDVLVELYRADGQNWGYILALRTGPHAFTKLLVARPWHGGACPIHITLRNGYVHRDGKRIAVPNEADFFTTMGVPYWQPADRTVGLLAAHLQQRHKENDG